MKPGAGDDLLDGDREPDEEDVDEDDQEESSEPSFEPPAETPLEDSDSIVPEPPHAGSDASGVPWVYTRENVKQDRDMVQFYLRKFVQEAEDDFVDEVNRALGTKASKTDIREAAYVAAMRDVDAVVDELERWGFEPGGS